jgi:SAM-dependent methyltransferase
MIASTAMTTANAAAWDRYSADYQEGARLPTEVAHYGPDIPDESELRLLGNLSGKRVLELGCGGAQCSIAFAKQGAHPVGVDFSAEQLAFARRLMEREKVKVDLRLGDLADLAFLRADTIDLAFSACVFNYVEDLDRVFRQVHRVLRTEAPIVFSVDHPSWVMVDDGREITSSVNRSYFDRQPMTYEKDGAIFTEFPRTVGDLFTSLHRSGFRVDMVLEPEPTSGLPRSQHWNDLMTVVPRTLIMRARKQGL